MKRELQLLILGLEEIRGSERTTLRAAAPTKAAGSLTARVLHRMLEA